MRNAAERPNGHRARDGFPFREPPEALTLRADAAKVGPGVVDCVLVAPFRVLYQSVNTLICLFGWIWGGSPILKQTASTQTSIA